MNRLQRVQEILRLEAIAAAATDRARQHRAVLDAEARAELEQHGTAPSWRMPGIGSVALSMSREAAVVADAPALTAWVAERHPTEVEHVVREAFRKTLLTRSTPAGDVVVDSETGEIIPGLGVRPGGTPRALTITPTRDARDGYRALGEELLDGLLTPAGAAVRA